MDLAIYNASYDFFCKAIEATNPQILEIGCGPGNVTRYLLSKRPDFQLMGIDNAPSMIDLARKNNPAAYFEVMDGRVIRQIDKKFQGVISGFCIPYLSSEDCTKLIADCHFKLEKDGFIYLSYVEGSPSKSVYITGNSGDRVYFHFHNLAFIQAQLRACGFEPLNVFQVDYPRPDQSSELHTAFIARKK